MKARQTIFLVVGAAGLVVVALLSVVTVSNRARQPRDPEPQAVADSHAGTPADLRIRAGESQIRLAPDKPDGYNLLVSAYLQKARETGDYQFNSKAEEALKKSFAVAPDNYDGIKLRAKLLLIYHRFGDALAEARRAQSQRPEDHDVYGALTDAYVELGDYEQAVNAAQTMVDLRPDAASYSRVAYLRSLHGDIEGAIEAMEVAVKAADPRDSEGLAWYRVHLGDELMNAGRSAEGEREYDHALAIFPGHELALAAKARARAAAGNYEVAIELYHDHKSHDRLLALGEIYKKLGRDEDARKSFEEFEAAERVAAAEENDMSHLARFWADHGVNLEDAVDVMRRERERRADVFTCDALAWALFRSGRVEEARVAINDALRLGSRDARINFHAGMIYNALGDRRRAAKHLRIALDINPSFDLLNSEIARHTLAALSEVQ
jgi:tetratricopeptide (TPR) repeat protein